MSITFIKGSIFNSKCQTIVNAVNCVGVMGKGIALVYKLRYPDMFNEYVCLCRMKEIQIGKVWLYKDDMSQWVLNFPTKNHWKYDSKIIYIEKGLQNFIETYQEQGITSIAFPLLGSQNGGIDNEIVKNTMIKYLSKCDIPIEIYEYDANVEDDLFLDFKNKFLSFSLAELSRLTNIKMNRLLLIQNALHNPSLKSIISLLEIKEIGLNTIEKCFTFVQNNGKEQLKLF